MAPANHSAVLLYFHFSLLDTFLVKVVQNQVDRLNLGEEMFYKELFYISWEFVDIVSWQMGGTFELLLTALKQVLNAVAERCRFHYWVLCSLCFYCQCHLFMSLICIRVWVSVLCMSHGQFCGRAIDDQMWWLSSTLWALYAALCCWHSLIHILSFEVEIVLHCW
jgi:hypothetical protein